MKRTLSAPAAHLMAGFTIIVWGSTFIASKLLLAVYTPAQIMLMRFALAYIVLWVLRPKPLILPWREELYFALLGIFGCSLYFMAENTAINCTFTSNVSIIVATAPMLTALLAHVVLPDEKLCRESFLGFGIAIIGVAMVVFNGTVILHLSPKGDLLSIAAALCWAVYSVLLKRRVGVYDELLMTRRTMLWGFITGLPVALVQGESFSLTPLSDGTLLFCVLFLGILGSGICYALWSLAAKRLGIVVVNNYIYVNPCTTMLTAGIVLHEKISLMGALGAAFILLGVFVSDRRSKKENLHFIDAKNRD
jgi:drug/metabolite transporter (DMT)-like permease